MQIIRSYAQANRQHIKGTANYGPFDVDLDKWATDDQFNAHVLWAHCCGTAWNPITGKLRVWLAGFLPGYLESWKAYIYDGATLRATCVSVSPNAPVAFDWDLAWGRSITCKAAISALALGAQTPGVLTLTLGESGNRLWVTNQEWVEGSLPSTTGEYNLSDPITIADLDPFYVPRVETVGKFPGANDLPLLPFPRGALYIEHLKFDWTTAVPDAGGHRDWFLESQDGLVGLQHVREVVSQGPDPEDNCSTDYSGNWLACDIRGAWTGYAPLYGPFGVPAKVDGLRLRFLKWCDGSTHTNDLNVVVTCGGRVEFRSFQNG